MILALDLGTSTGWAIGANEASITSGVENWKGGRFEGGGMRFLRFRRWLHDMRRFGMTEIVFEEVRNHKGVDAAHVYGGLMATLTAWSEETGIAYEGVPVGAIKRFATAKGNANKVAMIAAARAWGHSPATDDEADAIALLRLRLEETKAKGYGLEFLD